MSAIWWKQPVDVGDKCHRCYSRTELNESALCATCQDFKDNHTRRGYCVDCGTSNQLVVFDPDYGSVCYSGRRCDENKNARTEWLVEF